MSFFIVSYGPHFFFSKLLQTFLFLRNSRFIRTLISVLRSVFTPVRLSLRAVASLYLLVLRFTVTLSLVATVLALATSDSPHPKGKAISFIDSVIDTLRDGLSDPGNLFWSLFDLVSEFVSGYDWWGLPRRLKAVGYSEVQDFVLVFTEATRYISTELPHFFNAGLFLQIVILLELLDPIPRNLGLSRAKISIRHQPEEGAGLLEVSVRHQPEEGAGQLDGLLRFTVRDLLHGVDFVAPYDVLLICLRGTFSSLLLILLITLLFFVILYFGWLFGLHWLLAQTRELAGPLLVILVRVLPSGFDELVLNCVLLLNKANYLKFVRLVTALHILALLQWAIPRVPYWYSRWFR